MLNGTLVLHGVDAETLATEVCDRWTAKNRAQGSYLSESRREDLVAFLISECWRISVNFNPDRSQGFRSYAYSLLYFRCTDWLRKDAGRTVFRFASHTYIREQPQLQSLNDSDNDPLGQTLADTAGGDVTDRMADREWLEEGGDSRVARDHDLIRAAVAQRAA